MITQNNFDVTSTIKNTTLKGVGDHSTFLLKEWMTISDAAKYADVSYNTFIKFRHMGLKVCEIDGIKRVSRKEIDRFLESNSF